MKYTLFLLLILTLVACNSGGGGSSSGGNNTPSETIPSGPTYTVSGTITYDFIPITTSGVTGLNYAGKTQKPVRNVKIQARNVSGNGLVANGTTDDNGAFTIQVPISVSNYYINVIAQMATPNVTIEDNTNSNAIYLAQTQNRTNPGDTVLSNINLASGWGTTSYTGTRFSAPFAILDTVYTAHQKMIAARGDFSLPALKINWSKDNYSSGTYSPSTGAIGTSHFDGSELYILGLDGDDTDEFDRHVIVHEWGHFVEANISRADSVGGQHGPGDALQIATAFGEGWGNALSAMVLDPLTTYRDSYGTAQGSGFGFNMENGTDDTPGWYSEASVQQILFDVYDGANEATDTVSLGLGPIIDVLRGGQKTTSALTSIFSFIHYLKAGVSASVASDIDDLVSDKNILPITDIYGNSETANDGGDSNTLPIYKSLVHNTAATSTIGGGAFRYNEMRNNRYYRWTATSASTRFTLSCSRYCYIEARRDGKSLGYLESTTGTATISTVIGQEYILNLTTDTTATGSITTSLKAEAL